MFFVNLDYYLGLLCEMFMFVAFGWLLLIRWKMQPNKLRLGSVIAIGISLLSFVVTTLLVQLSHLFYNSTYYSNAKLSIWDICNCVTLAIPAGLLTAGLLLVIDHKQNRSA